MKTMRKNHNRGGVTLLMSLVLVCALAIPGSFRRDHCLLISDKLKIGTAAYPPYGGIHQNLRSVINADEGTDQKHDRNICPQHGTEGRKTSRRTFRKLFQFRIQIDIVNLPQNADPLLSPKVYVFLSLSPQPLLLFHPCPALLEMPQQKSGMPPAKDAPAVPICASSTCHFFTFSFSVFSHLFQYHYSIRINASQSSVYSTNFAL